MTIGVARRDGFVPLAVGMANPETGKAMLKKTTMLAASMLQLVEAGKLDLDAPIPGWLWPAVRNVFTIS